METALRRMFGTLCFIVAISLSTQGFAQQHLCSAPFAAVQSTAEGVCPTVVDNHATCTSVAAQAKLTNPVPFTTQLPNVSKTFTTTVNGNTYAVNVALTSSSTFKFTDLSLNGTSTVSQQADTPGLEAIIVAGASSGLLYSRVNWVTDTGLTNTGGNIGGSTVTFCWSQGPCLLDQTSVVNACNAYNPGSTRTADILQAIKDATPLPTNICGCPPKVVRQCDPSLSSTVVFPENIGGVCNPSTTGGNLNALQAESTVKTGTSSCVIKQIGGTYYQSCF